MIRLLRAGFRRYTHSFVFWLAVAVTVGSAVVCGAQARKFYFEDFYVMVFLIANAVMISWLIGREHDEGIFRNKIITGHTKGSVYFAELLSGILFSSLLYLLFSAVFLGMNHYIIGHAPTGVCLKLFFNGLLASACATAIFVTVSCLISRTVVTGIINILLIFGLLLGSENISSALKRPEHFERYEYENIEIVDEEGNVYLQMSPIEGSMYLADNPNYIKSPAREILTVISRISPFTSIGEGGDITFDWFGYDMHVNINGCHTSHSAWENEADFSVTADENTALNISSVFSFTELISVGCAGYFFFRKKSFR